MLLLMQSSMWLVSITCKGTLLTHIQPRTLQILFCIAATHPTSLQSIPNHGCIPSQVQKFALTVVRLHEVCASPFFQFIEVPLNGSPKPPAYEPLPSIWCHPQSCWSSKSPVVQVTDEDVKYSRALLTPEKYYLLPDFEPLSIILWAQWSSQWYHLLCSPSKLYMSLQFGY